MDFKHVSGLKMQKVIINKNPQSTIRKIQQQHKINPKFRLIIQ